MKTTTFKKSLWTTTVIPLSLAFGAVGVAGAVSDQLSFAPAAVAQCKAACAACNPCAAKNPCAAAKK